MRLLGHTCLHAYVKITNYSLIYGEACLGRFNIKFWEKILEVWKALYISNKILNKLEMHSFVYYSAKAQT